ncbi:AT-hook motif nuclear-localized protein 4 [Hirschfeldia incana]|nr:AT-hook motif nuclear-localized protein 4 [Hirschfeldia incana]
MEEREGTSNNNNNNITSVGPKQHAAPPPTTTGGVHQMGPPRSLPNTNAASASASAVIATAYENAAPPLSLTIPVGSSSSGLMMKKRGRPRKYNPDGSPVTLSPMPISSFVPLTTVFPPRERGGRGRGRGRERGQTRADPPSNNSNWPRNPRMFELNNSSAGTSQVAGSSLTPHMLTVNVGEDVTMKIMTFFSQQGSRAICILSASGPVSSVTLRQSLTSADTLTYEGHFDILSLTGSFITSETGGIRSRAGGMSVSLAAPDGSVFGGGLSGVFTAAGPVQVMVGTFEAGQEEPQQQQQMQNQRRERLGISMTTQASNISFGGGSAEDPKARYGPNRPVVIQAPPVSARPVSLPHEPNTNAAQGYYTNNTADQIGDLFTSLPGEDDEEEDEDFEGEDDDEEVGSDSESDAEVSN